TRGDRALGRYFHPDGRPGRHAGPIIGQVLGITIGLRLVEPAEERDRPLSPGQGPVVLAHLPPAEPAPLPPAGPPGESPWKCACPYKFGDRAPGILPAAIPRHA